MIKAALRFQLVSQTKYAISRRATHTSISMTDSVPDLTKALQAAGISQGYIITSPNGHPVASHAVFQSIASFLSTDILDYDRHEAIFFKISPHTGVLMSVFLWKTKRGQGYGGIRLRPYDTIEYFIRDGLRLSQAMGRKCSLADLHYGGGKGIIPSEVNTEMTRRQLLLQDFGEFVSSLRGCYVAASDVGISGKDVDAVVSLAFSVKSNLDMCWMQFSRTRFIMCISPQLGGSGDPSNLTALGVKVAMESALDATVKSTLAGKTVAIQGLGKVGGALVTHLLKSGVDNIIGSDTSHNKISRLLRKHSADKDRVDFRVEKHDTPIEKSVLSEECDILSPCGYGGILTDSSVPHIKAKIICGAANNQLFDWRRDYGLRERGIVYVPDFLCNRMGIVACANEPYGSIGDLSSIKDPLINRHLDRESELSIYQVTQKVIHMSENQNISTEEAARQLADVHAESVNPICGHRTKDIIQSLVEDGWENHVQHPQIQCVQPQHSLSMADNLDDGLL